MTDSWSTSDGTTHYPGHRLGTHGVSTATSHLDCGAHREPGEMIPFAAPDIGPLEKQAVREVLDSGHLAAGEEVEEFETEFANACGTSHGVATSNGTTALHAALQALGIGEGDRVITTPLSFIATANAIRFCGATPVFVDIDPETYNLDPAAVERALRDDDAVSAIVAVHLYGLPADMGRLADVASDYDCALVEDAAQAHGARYEGEPVGSLGDVGCFSFYPTKNMTTGEGGMITTDDEAVARRARRFIDHGRETHHRHVTLGHNFRMTDIAAAIGRIQLDKLHRATEIRRENAATFTDVLEGTDLVCPIEPDGRHHAYHLYTVRTTERNRFRAHLRDADVSTGVYYPVPIHEQPAYARTDGSFPVASRTADEVVSLPVYPGLSPDAVDSIAAAAREFGRQ